jgi:DNA-binding LacI/PurR family transcriptional regulator
MPLVFYDRCAYGIGASCVSIDDEESARRITNHLIGHGYDPIAHLSGSQRVSIGLARLKGFRQAMAERGRVVRDDLIVEAGFHESDGYAAMKKLLDRPRETWPRAVVAVNDPAAFGAIKAIRERNLRIPQDIALVGFSDDIRAALMPTPLTTIRQPAYEIGKQAALKLISVIEGKSLVVEDIVVKAEEVIRESCGCVKSNESTVP